MEKTLISRRSVCKFGFELNRIIDAGASETFDTIENQIEDRTLVEYLVGKYKLEIPEDSFPVLNDWFAAYQIHDSGEFTAKYGVSRNGLNVVMALILRMLDD